MKNASPSSNLLTEEREEVIVSEKGRCLRKTHFLKPFVTSIDDDGTVAELPHCGDPRLSVSSSELKSLSSRICFSGFWSANHRFVSWLKKMEALHAPTWRKAGIYEAIKASTYKISKNPSLLVSIAKKWCPETKSFVFPWGEATITLEDVMVLLGFSVLGSPIFAPLESSEMRYAIEKLEKVRLENLNKNMCVRKGSWISSFLGKGDQLEHEAFLALWLSHFVFPDKYRPSVSVKTLPVAVRLARGERVALAPAVLARLYKDLGEISRDKSTKNLYFQSLFKLLQVWTWERFKKLRPEAKEIPKGEPRLSRWDRLQRKTEDVRLSFDDFEWRPYTKPLTNWNPPRFYVEESMWVTVDDKLEDEFVSFARCVRSSQLVGIGFVEDYYPNRVAMQFGMAQDCPGLVTRRHSNVTEKEAWDDYNKSLDGFKLFIPSRLSTTSVTARYQDWWLKSVSRFLLSSDSTETFNLSNSVVDDDDDNVSHKVLPLSQVFQKLGMGFPANLRRCRSRRRAKNLRCKMEKDKTSNGDVSASTELALSRLFQKELVKKKIECVGYKRRKRAREDDAKSNDNITTAQSIIKSREINGGNASESLGKRSKLEDDNNGSEICQKLAFGDNETIPPPEIEERNKKSDETGSKAGKNVVLSSFDDNTSSDPALGANRGVYDIVKSPRETRKTCDDDLVVYGSNACMTNDGSSEPKCLLQEDGVITGEKQRSDENEDVVDDDSLIYKKLALKTDNNESIPCQKLANEDGSKAYKSMVLSPPDESNIHIAVGDGSQGQDCLFHDNALRSEETKRNDGFGEGNDSYEKRFHKLKELASSIEDRIIKAQKNMASLIEWRALKRRKIAAAYLN
ncbi:PREDICTED: uncharacterized protein LOC104742607 [Camelina sativa]|uniref:Uncharacterized protein LOC104742607 n=1 Tax=Camelina sativa TaxID=90675 RepID=A0ABM0VW39_CAMSA|nr:PREDICTED: uncharacterized protein LOC104742607 [Camelina sativa]